MRLRGFSTPRAIGLAFSIAALSVSAIASAEEEEEVAFDEAEFFFELNDTDGDLGIHALIDGEDWRRLRIEDPGERIILDVSARGRLGRHGLTELAFESAEPRFDELPAAEIFARFPAGTYEIEGITLDGGELESEVDLSHVIPAPAGNVQISGVAAPASCNAAIPTVAAPIVIRWDAVTSSHPTLGVAGAVLIETYEVVVEVSGTEFSAQALLPPSSTSYTVAADLLALGSGSFKFEILARDANGNRTAVESCFDLQ